MRIDTTVIARNISKGQQDVRFTEVLRLGDHTLRIDIRSDSYREQCHARIDRWDGTRWQRVHDILPGSMQTANGLVYKPLFRDAAVGSLTGVESFQADADELLRVALDVIITH